MATIFHQGTPITREMAIELRQLVFGSAAAPPRGEWARSGFVFSTAKEELAFGLKCQRNGTRGLYSVVQGFILKYLLFDKRGKTKLSKYDQVLKPTESVQKDALVSSLAEILTIIAEKSPICMVLPGKESFIGHSVTYFQDSVTEKLHLFYMRRGEEVSSFLRVNLDYFLEDPGPGTLLFLYSAVLSRTISKVRTDLDQRSQYLIGPREEGSINVVTLLLTGRATPYLHNGVIHVGDEENYAIPQYGILSRTTIGMLLYENDIGSVGTRQPGSRLKTPFLPIWVTYCLGHYGVLYNTNQELLRNYHAESRFELFYYSCSGNQILMTIDNRMHNDKATLMLQRQSSVALPTMQAEMVASRKEDGGNTPLDRLIQTKWEEASTTFHGPASLLSYLFSTN